MAGAKEGDYIVSIQDVDCKWLTVSEVIKLLKSFGQNDIEMKVVSLLDATSSMVSADAPWQQIATWSEVSVSPAPEVFIRTPASCLHL